MAALCLVLAASGIGRESRKAYEQGLRWERASQPERAIQAFSDAIKAAPDNWEAYAHRAALRLGIGDLTHAIEDLDAVIRSRPDDAEAYRMRADAFFQWRNLGEQFAAKYSVATSGANQMANAACTD